MRKAVTRYNTDVPANDRPTPTPPRIDPPRINPPTIDPPTIDPPTINPPTINPPTINRPALSLARTEELPDLFISVRIPLPPDPVVDKGPEWVSRRKGVKKVDIPVANTSGAIARRLSTRTSRVNFVIKKLGITPVAFAGRARIFADEDLPRIVDEVEAINERQWRRSWPPLVWQKRVPTSTFIIE